MKPPMLAKVSVTPIIVPANIGATSDGLIYGVAKLMRI